LCQVDAFTGKTITLYTNAQSMSAIQGPNGEILSYTYNYASKWLALWNSTLAVEATGSGSNTTAATLSPTGGQSYTPYSTLVRNWQAGIQWNETIPTVSAVYTGVTGMTSPTFTYGQMDYPDGVLVAVASFYTNTTNPIWEDIGYSINYNSFGLLTGQTLVGAKVDQNPLDYTLSAAPHSVAESTVFTLEKL
jgi:hypothetical protein